jgi:predicted flavoprotein YhiN
MKKLLAVLLAATLLFTLAACGGGTTKQADLGKVMTDMKTKITNKDMMDLSKDDLMTNYGIEAADVKQFAAYIDSTGTKGDEIVFLEGKDADAAKRIKEKLDARYKQKEVEMKDYLPEEYAMLKKCSINQDGNYVSMIVSPQYEELSKIYNAAIK